MELNTNPIQNKKYGLSKRNLTAVAFFLTGISLSLISSFIVINTGCGTIQVLECGYYAGFPVPYARFSDKAFKSNGGSFVVNPTLYYKYKFSPLKNDQHFAKEFLSDGTLIPFFLFDSSLYSVNIVLFILNIVIWLLPAGFLVGVFF